MCVQLHTLTYKLANFPRTLALPTRASHWSLTMLCEKLVKFGAKVARRSRSVIFRLAEVAVTPQDGGSVPVAASWMSPHGLRVRRQSAIIYIHPVGIWGMSG